MLNYFVVNKHKIIKIFTYLFFDGLNKGLPFILMAFIALKLPPEQLGLYSTKTIIFVFLNALIGMGLTSQLIVSLKKESEKIDFVITSILLIFIFNFLISIFLGFIVELNDIAINNIEFYPVLISSLSFSIIQIQLSMYQAKFDARSFGFLNLILSIVMSSSIYGTVTLTNSQDKVWLYISICYSVIALCILTKLLKKHNRISFNILRKYYKLGLLQIPHLLSNWVKLGFDRLVLLKFVSSTQLGVYSLYLQFGLIISTILQSLNRYWSVYIISMLSEKKDRRTVKLRIIQFCFLSLFLSIGISLISFYVVKSYFPSVYQSDLYLIFIIGFAYACQGCYFSLVNIIFYMEKTYLLNIASVSSSAFHVLFSYYFVGILQAGYEWVAFSLLLSWFFNFIITYLVVKKHDKTIYGC